MMVFREFFLVSNSGPLIKDILRTRYEADGARSIRRGTASPSAAPSATRST